MRFGLCSGVTVAFVLVATLGVDAAPTFVHEGLLLGNSAEAALGSAVSVSGDTAVVGAPDEDTSAGERAGAAYVFVRSGTTWTLQQRLQAPDGAPLDAFGWSVAAFGDTVLIGALHADTAPGETGAAYVFVRSGTTWTLQQKLVVVDFLFGYSASLSSDTAVVGAPSDGAAGSAYVFLRSGTTWTQQQRLLAADGMAFDGLGSAVSISGDTIVAGAPKVDYSVNAPGAAYVFVRSGATWTQQQKLLASDGVEHDTFGISASISGDTIILGALYHLHPGGGGGGSAYTFVRAGTTWTEQQELLPGDAGAGAFGYSVAISGDKAAAGAPLGVYPTGANAGSVYVFGRSGTAWTQRQKLLALGGAADDKFGTSVSFSNDTVVGGAPGDDTAVGANAGSAHVFREFAGPGADLGVTKTDGQANTVPGSPLTYTIVVSDGGPDAVAGAAVTDVLPAAVQGATWTCAASPGSSCSPSGAGNINDTVSLAVGGTATYTLAATVASGALGTLSNTASVAPPAGVTDPSLSNNSATDTNLLTPHPDLAIAKADSADPVSQGDPLTYTLTVTNLGPSDDPAVTVSDPLPAGVTFVASTPGPPQCALAGSTLDCSLGPMAAGATATVTIDVTVNAAIGLLVNTATVSAFWLDLNPDNNSASAVTSVGSMKGELSHGTELSLDLAAQPGPVADVDIFRIYQAPHSSYEVVVDATSGDVGAGSGPSLDRTAEGGTSVLQSSLPVGVGPSRSLRWYNPSAFAKETDTVRVRSAGCTTDCGTDDVYRIRAYETTYAVPRFNNSGTQVTVLVLHNPTTDIIVGYIYYLLSSGAQVAEAAFSLFPHQTAVINTTGVPGVNHVSGSIRIAHNGRYGSLVGKTVALEPATGFSFDSALEPRPK